MLIIVKAEKNVSHKKVEPNGIIILIALLSTIGRNLTQTNLTTYIAIRNSGNDDDANLYFLIEPEDKSISRSCSQIDNSVSGSVVKGS